VGLLHGDVSSSNPALAKVLKTFAGRAAPLDITQAFNALRS